MFGSADPTAARQPPTTLRDDKFSSIGCRSGLSGNDFPGRVGLETADGSAKGNGESKKEEESESMMAARRCAYSAMRAFRV